MSRTKRVNLRLSEQECQELKILATREGRNLSELARELLRDAMEARTLKTFGAIFPFYKEIVAAPPQDQGAELQRRD